MIRAQSHGKILFLEGSFEQRKRYLTLCRLTISSYAGTDGYSGERFEIEDIEQRKGDIVIDQQSCHTDKESVAFHYLPGVSRTDGG
jgi:hypothetical protein